VKFAPQWRKSLESADCYFGGIETRNHDDKQPRAVSFAPNGRAAARRVAASPRSAVRRPAAAALACARGLGRSLRERRSVSATAYLAPRVAGGSSVVAQLKIAVEENRADLAAR
jgi:hypothetical protein